MRKLEVEEMSKEVKESKIKELFKLKVKSDVIRGLFDLGYDVKEICELWKVNRMEVIRYNMVNNVVRDYVLKNGIKLDGKKRRSRKDDVKELMSKGMGFEEIVFELKCSSNYVYKLMKEVREEEELKKLMSK